MKKVRLSDKSYKHLKWLCSTWFPLIKNKPMKVETAVKILIRIAMDKASPIHREYPTIFK